MRPASMYSGTCVRQSPPPYCRHLVFFKFQVTKSHIYIAYLFKSTSTLLLQPLPLVPWVPLKLSRVLLVRDTLLSVNIIVCRIVLQGKRAVMNCWAFTYITWFYTLFSSMNTCSTHDLHTYVHTHTLLCTQLPATILVTTAYGRVTMIGSTSGTVLVRSVSPPTNWPPVSASPPSPSSSLRPSSLVNPTPIHQTPSL